MPRQSFATTRPFPLQRASCVWLLQAVAVVGVVVAGAAQQPAPNLLSVAGSISPTTGIRVVPVVRGLSHPWNFAFLPDGTVLVTERPGRLRVIRKGVLNPQPIVGVPKVSAGRGLGLMGVAVHPRFAENNLIYLTYSKPGERGSTPALARGRFDGTALQDVYDIFVANAWDRETTYAASAIAFGPDGLLYMTVGGAINATTTGKRAQDPSDHTGKLVRLRDDGSVPNDNPFVGRADYKPEIYALGFRNQLGLAVHPDTGLVWASENGPLGGDEVNVILPGRNYGWPLVSYGREYGGPRVSERPWQEGMEQPAIVWIPSIAPSGMAFYTGDRFPAWKGDLFVASLQTGRVWGTGHLERIVLNKKGEEQHRESLLTDLKERIRDVRQGPDGLLYVLTEADEAVLLRIEPAR